MITDREARMAGWALVVACVFGVVVMLLAWRDGCAHVPHSPCLVEVR